jgi:hypothetical protein
MISEDIERLVDKECAIAAFIPLASALAGFRVKPFERMLRWPYGSADEKLPCWIVGDLGAKKPGLQLAYSKCGHGKRGDHWGIIDAGDASFGRDDSWFSRLEDAFIGAGMWSESLPSHYEIG